MSLIHQLNCNELSSTAELVTLQLHFLYIDVLVSSGFIVLGVHLAGCIQKH